MAKYDGKWLQAGMIRLFSTFPNSNNKCSDTLRRGKFILEKECLNASMSKLISTSREKINEGHRGTFRCWLKYVHLSI